jgi:dUTP pyrophosphatase
MTERLEIKLLSNNATTPTRNNLDAGYDIYAAETKIIEPQEKALIATDLAVNIPQGYVGLLTSRSGVSSKTHLVIETGKIDAGYQGHMKINIKNERLPIKKRKRTPAYLDISGGGVLEIRNNKKYKIGTYQINKGDKLAQLVIVPIFTPELLEVTDFSNETARGQQGFGSTGY